LEWSSFLLEATLLKRYKRFLADIKLGEEFLTVHVPNTGSMQSCWEPDWKCAVSRSSNPKRKMPYTLEMTHNGSSWIGVNTGNANKLAKIWLTEGLLPELAGYEIVQPEKKIGESRLDFYLEGHPTNEPCYVEVKNVTLKLDGEAQFPDSVSERGQKHLSELISIKKSGLRAAMLFIVQREDVSVFRPAKTLDPTYASLLLQAHQQGVEILVYQCKMNLNKLDLKGRLPFHLD
jgi:sugar fermentation stimulation protein A